eukprot:CAMPEP_0182419898 /NCGR_PEP_ID=MMETSP1167-20130531/4242_1 /TAXON_ID=2988 /ORGANISM="Mallomonas Sp, Strain CCMP3275" /LENGTH=101 /DNA_ID=CAMNT_0024595051 /DNA_START=118 /DNA_END=423 /DNA_ORIENTATION=+
MPNLSVAEQRKRAREWAEKTAAANAEAEPKKKKERQSMSATSHKSEVASVAIEATKKKERKSMSSTSTKIESVKKSTAEAEPISSTKKRMRVITEDQKNSS